MTETSAGHISIDLTSVDFKEELLGLRLMYPPFHLEFPKKDTEDRNSSFQCRLTLRPSDPDICTTTLCPRGIELELTYTLCEIHTNENLKPQSYCRPSIVYPSHFISCALQCIHPLLKGIFQYKICHAFYTALQHSRSAKRCVYFAMSAVNHCIASAFLCMSNEEPENYRKYIFQFQPLIWAQEDQLRLEQALVLYRKIVDTKLKWKNISAYVSVNGRHWSPKDCVTQFLKCREALITQSQVSPPPCLVSENKATSASRNSAVCLSEENSTHFTNAYHRVVLSSLVLRDLLFLYVTVLRVKTICTRCQTPTIFQMKFPVQALSSSSVLHKTSPDMDDKHDKQPNTSLRFGVASKTTQQVCCSKCSITMTLIATAEVVTETQCCLVRYSASGLLFQDVMQPDLFTECMSCSTPLVLRGVVTGVSRIVRCSTCFSTGSFSYQSISVEGPTFSHATPFSLLEKKKKKISSVALKLGTPLPLHGSCKHYKKSFRWLRFPCCGQAFPCDICHDTSTDHPCDWANRVICGYCSKEQNYSNKSCTCGHNFRISKSTHWEGGKGCRNRIMMSRKDNRKYKTSHGSKKASL